MSSLQQESFEDFEKEFFNIEFRRELFEILLSEYGNVIRREMIKPKQTLETVLKDGRKYIEFLEAELSYVHLEIGEFPEGRSFYEKIYFKEFGEGEFDETTAKNIIIQYRVRIENILIINEPEKDPRLKESVENVFKRLIQSPDDVAFFNLQENKTSDELIAIVRRIKPVPSFVAKAKILIQRQSMVLTNLMNEIFIITLRETILEEQKLKNVILVRQKKVEEDLNRARKIQQNLLPKSYPFGSELKFFARYIPMESVGGDFYDIVKFRSFKNSEQFQKFGLLIADVSGHGIPAAFIASMAKISWKNTISRFHRPSDILKQINMQLLENTAGNFVTALVAVFKLSETKGNFLEISNAGHYIPYILRKNGENAYTQELKGKVLGVFPKVEYQNLSIPIQNGDRFIFYTDGLLEARRNDTKELLGEERLYQIFDSTYGLDGDASCATILRKVIEFTNDPQFEDDITLLIVDFG